MIHSKKAIDIISESPISSWEIASDFDQREKEMKDNYKKNYGRDEKFSHYTKADKRAIRDQNTISHIKLAFEKVPVKINLFFYQHNRPNYNSFLQRGKTDLSWISNTFGKETAIEIKKWFDNDAINVVMTNNLSDNHPVSLKSPWMVAHRIAHSIAQGTNPSLSKKGVKIDHVLKEMITQILILAYSYDLDFSRYGFNAHIFEQEHIEILGTILGKKLGTFKSAREETLVQVTDWAAEMYTQWLLTGKITFNKLPDVFDGRKITNDPKKIKYLNDLMRKAPNRFSRIFTAITENAKGHIWLM